MTGENGKAAEATEKTEITTKSILPESPQSESSPVHRTFGDTWRGWRLYVVQLFLLLGLLLSQMESSIVATSLVTISVYFDDFIKATWIVLAYLLSYMGFSVIFTRCSDVFGRKWAVIGAWVLFSGFSLGCGLAQSLNQLIGFRALQGIGGSGLFSMTMVCLPEITPPKRFPAISGAIGATFAIASVVGPVLGGVITKESTWRWIFLFNVPFGGVAVTVILLSWPARSDLAPKISLKAIDYIGAILLLAASVLLVFALQEAGGHNYSWNSHVIISTLVVSAICWLAFSFWVWWLPKSSLKLVPTLPWAIVSKRVMAAAILSTCLTGFSFILVIIQLPIRFQLVNGDSPIQAGVKLMPLLGASALGSGVGGAASSKKNRTGYTTIVASCFILLGCGLLSTLSTGSSIESKQYGFQVLFGFGVGLTFASVTVLTAAESNVTDTAVAQGTITQARMLGGSIGLTIATIVFNHKAVISLSGLLTKSQLLDLERSPNTAVLLGPEKLAAVRVVFAEAFNGDLRICTYVAAVSVLVALCTYQKNPPNLSAKRAQQEEYFEDRRREEEA